MPKNRQRCRPLGIAPTPHTKETMERSAQGTGVECYGVQLRGTFDQYTDYLDGGEMLRTSYSVYQPVGRPFSIDVAIPRGIATTMDECMVYYWEPKILLTKTLRHRDTEIDFTWAKFLKHLSSYNATLPKALLRRHSYCQASHVSGLFIRGHRDANYNIVQYVIPCLIRFQE